MKTRNQARKGWLVAALSLLIPVSAAAGPTASAPAPKPAANVYLPIVANYFTNRNTVEVQKTLPGLEYSIKGLTLDPAKNQYLANLQKTLVAGDALTPSQQMLLSALAQELKISIVELTKKPEPEQLALLQAKAESISTNIKGAASEWAPQAKALSEAKELTDEKAVLKLYAQGGQLTILAQALDADLFKSLVSSRSSLHKKVALVWEHDVDGKLAEAEALSGAPIPTAALDTDYKIDTSMRFQTQAALAQLKAYDPTAAGATAPNAALQKLEHITLSEDSEQTQKAVAVHLAATLDKTTDLTVKDKLATLLHDVGLDSAFPWIKTFAAKRLLGPGATLGNEEAGKIADMAKSSHSEKVVVKVQSLLAGKMSPAKDTKEDEALAQAHDALQAHLEAARPVALPVAKPAPAAPAAPTKPAEPSRAKKIAGWFSARVNFKRVIFLVLLAVLAGFFAGPNRLRSAWQAGWRLVDSASPMDEWREELKRPNTDSDTGSVTSSDTAAITSGLKPIKSKHQASDIVPGSDDSMDSLFGK